MPGSTAVVFAPNEALEKNCGCARSAAELDTRPSGGPSGLGFFEAPWRCQLHVLGAVLWLTYGDATYSTTSTLPGRAFHLASLPLFWSLAGFGRNGLTFKKLQLGQLRDGNLLE